MAGSFTRATTQGTGTFSWPTPMAEMSGSLPLTATTMGHRAVCDGGRAVVYSTNFDGIDHLWKLDLQSGASTKLTNGLGENNPACQGTGQWVMYNGQVTGGSSYIFKTPISGGAPVRVSDRISSGVAILSLDGRHVLFGSFDKNGTIVGVMVSAVTGAQEGAEIKLGDTLSDSAHGVRWTPDGRSLAAVDIRSGTPNLWSGILGKGPAKQLTHFTSGVVWDFGWSSDGKYIALARGTDQSDAVLFSSAK